MQEIVTIDWYMKECAKLCSVNVIWIVTFLTTMPYIIFDVSLLMLIENIFCIMIMLGCMLLLQQLSWLTCSGNNLVISAVLSLESEAREQDVMSVAQPGCDSSSKWLLWCCYCLYVTVSMQRRYDTHMWVHMFCTEKLFHRVTMKNTCQSNSIVRLLIPWVRK